LFVTFEILIHLYSKVKNLAIDIHYLVDILIF